MENLKLNSSNLSKISERVLVPNYNRSDIKTGIVHVGIGGFHRSHEAFYIDQLLQNNKNKEWGICGVALLDHDTKIYNSLKQQDGLYTLIVKELDGTYTNRVIGSIVEYLFAPDNPGAVIEKMAGIDVKIITLTITEGGYNYSEISKEFNFENPLIDHDLKHPKSPKTIFGYLTEALCLRKQRGLKGLTIQSCDNIQGNGDMIKKMLLSYINFAKPGLVDWVKNNVSFPNAMVDRITPATEEKDILTLEKTIGVLDTWPVVCEPFSQWVIEDDFIQGRPEWEKVGAQFVADVVPYEKMKLSLLNAGHSVIGILGALLGYQTIDQAVQDKNISTFLHLYMNVEVTPILGDLEGLDLDLYKKTLFERFGNKNIKDQIERICSESSAKFPIFILPTVKAQLKNNGSVDLAAFIVAAWAIYSLGKDENGVPLVIKDANKLLLDVKATAAVTNPEAFLELETIFGELKNSTKFKEAYIKAYNNITNNGVEQCLREINSNSLSHI